MRWSASLACGVFLTCLLAAPSVSLAQAVRCRDDAALVKALADHLAFSTGFRTKFVTGTYVLPRQATHRQVEARALLAADDLQRRLAALSDEARPTLALVHHLSASEHLEVWLIGAEGILARSISSQPYRGIDSLQVSLDVPRRTAPFTPQERSSQPPRTMRPLSRSAATIGRSSRPVDTASPDASLPPQSTAEALATFSDILLTPEARRLLAARAGRLLVVPALDTGVAPYAALPLDATQHLSARWSVIVMPDIQTLVREDRRFELGPLRWRDALIVGDPDLSRDDTRIWPALPGARDEARIVADKLAVSRDRVLIGAEATKIRVLGAIDGFQEASLIYLASHGIADPDDPMDGSFVALTGGHLYGRDLRSSRLLAWEAHHPLVVLSACQTGLGKLFKGGTYGMARAWISAGAGQVVASLWKIGDEPTRVLMTAFAERLAVGFAPEDALRSAQNDMAARFPDDPAAWAGFAVFGAPTTDRPR